MSRSAVVRPLNGRRQPRAPSRRAADICEAVPPRRRTRVSGAASIARNVSTIASFHDNPSRRARRRWCPFSTSLRTPSHSRPVPISGAHDSARSCWLICHICWSFCQGLWRRPLRHTSCASIVVAASTPRGARRRYPVVSVGWLHEAAAGVVKSRGQCLFVFIVCRALALRRGARPPIERVAAPVRHWGAAPQEVFASESGSRSQQNIARFGGAHFSRQANCAAVCSALRRSSRRRRPCADPARADPRGSRLKQVDQRAGNVEPGSLPQLRHQESVDLEQEHFARPTGASRHRSRWITAGRSSQGCCSHSG